jgi:hypothetical protein
MAAGWEPRSKAAKRWGVSVRTATRWEATGVVDPPEYVNGRAFHKTTSEPRRSAAMLPPRKAESASTSTAA